MVELHHLFIALYVGTAVLALAVVALAWRRRAARGARPLAALMLGIAIWSGASAAMWYVPTLSQQVFWLGATFLGVWMVPVAVMALALDIAKVGPWRNAVIALLITVSLAFVGIAWLNPGHLYNTAFVAQAIGPFTHYNAVPGPLYDAYDVFAFAAIIAGLAIILRVYLRSSGGERTQAAVVFFGGLIPLFSSAITESRMVPLFGLDLAPLAFLITGILWLVAVLRGTLLDIIPIARDALVEQMLEGVVVVDGEDQVVDVNPAALTILRKPMTEVLGKSAEAVLGDLEGATALLGGSGPRSAVLTTGSGDDVRHVGLGVTRLVRGSDRSSAHLITLHDVTEAWRASERLQLARTVFDTVNEGIAVATPHDPVRRIIEVNDAFCLLTGSAREDLVGKDLSCIQSDRHSPEFHQAVEQALSIAGEWIGEIWHKKADGTEFPSWTSLSVAKDDQGQERYAVGVFTDITDIKEAERVSRSEGLYRALAELTPDLVFVINANNMRVALGNSAAARFVGRSVEQFKGARVSELFGPVGAKFEDNVSRVAETGQPHDDEESIPIGDSEVWLKSSLVSLADVAPGLVLGVSRDITDSKRLERVLRGHAEEAEYFATHDSLTCLSNRRAFMATLAHALALSRRGTSATMLFMDIDGFKRCNDERGHAFGDEILISVASLLKKEVREVDLVARVGGDEFAVLLAGIDESGALPVAKRMKASVEALGADQGIPLGLSVGIAGVDADADRDHVMSTADQRMYGDKVGNSTDSEGGAKTWPVR